MQPIKFAGSYDVVHLDRLNKDTRVDLAVDHIGYVEHAPGACTRLDRRDHNILHYVESGQGVFTCLGVDYQIAGGDVYLFPKNVDVSYQADATNPWRIYYVGFYGEKDDEYLRQLGLSAGHVVLRQAPGAKLAAYYRGMLNTAHNSEASRTFLAGYLYLILGELLQSKRIREDAAIPIDMFHAMTNYIRTNLGQQLRVATIADVFHISQSQMFRVFKAQCGLSPHQYVEKSRIDFACSLIRQSRLSFREIALRCGYEYESHFYKSFQKIMETTPSKYRQMK